MTVKVLVLSCLVLSACAYGPAGGYDETQDEQPSAQGAAVSHVTPPATGRERATRPEIGAPAVARELAEGDREPILRSAE
jgi:hypothetical protein